MSCIKCSYSIYLPAMCAEAFARIPPRLTKIHLNNERDDHVLIYRPFDSLLCLLLRSSGQLSQLRIRLCRRNKLTPILRLSEHPHRCLGLSPRARSQSSDTHTEKPAPPGLVNTIFAPLRIQNQGSFNASTLRGGSRGSFSTIRA